MHVYLIDLINQTRSHSTCSALKPNPVTRPTHKTTKFWIPKKKKKPQNLTLSRDLTLGFIAYINVRDLHDLHDFYLNWAKRPQIPTPRHAMKGDR